MFPDVTSCLLLRAGSSARALRGGSWQGLPLLGVRDQELGGGTASGTPALLVHRVWPSWLVLGALRCCPSVTVSSAPLYLLLRVSWGPQLLRWGTGGFCGRSIPLVWRGSVHLICLIANPISVGSVRPGSVLVDCRIAFVDVSRPPLASSPSAKLNIGLNL